MNEVANLPSSTDLHGLYDGWPSEDYHGSPGLSFTQFKHFLRSPLHYKAYLAKPKPQTASQKLGSMLHMALLEPEKFAKTTIYIDGPLNTNPWKKMGDEAKAAGITPIGKQMWEDITGMRDSVLKHKLGSLYVASGQKELSAFWKDPETGLLLRCRPDIWIESKLQVVDVKTCGNVQTFPMIEMMRNMYPIQTAFYLFVMSGLTQMQLTQHTNLCVEDEYPYAVQNWALDDASIERSMIDVKNGLRKFAKCLETDTWDGPEPIIRPAALAHYAWAYDPEMEEQHV